MKWLTMGTVVLAMSAISGLAAADEKDAAQEKGGATRQKLLEKYDANGNGKLDPDELEKAKADRGNADAKGGQPGADATGDKPGADGIRERMLKMFDKDGDGKLSDEERQAAAKARGEFGKKGGAGSREELMKRFDKDGDGKLSDAEKTAAKEAFKNRAGGAPGGRPNMEEAIKRFDKDGDGKLNDAEKAAAREAFKSRAKKGKKPE